MIAVKDQQGAIRAQVERLDQRAKQRVRIGDVANILTDRIARFRKTTRSIGVMGLHRHRHGEERLPGLNRLLDLADQQAPHGAVAYIGTETVGLRESVLADETVEAELGNSPVAAEEPRVVRVKEERAPAAGPQPRRQRGRGDALGTHIGIETVHSLLGEGDAGEHLDFGAVRVRTEARNLQPSRSQGPGTKSVEPRKFGGDALPAYVAEGFGLDEDYRPVAIAEMRGLGRTMDRCFPLRTPPGEAGGKGSREAELADHVASGGMAKRGKCLDPRSQRTRHQQRGERDASRQDDRLNRRADGAGLHRHPSDNERQNGADEQGETRRLAPAEVEQRRVADQRRDETEIAEHQRLAQIAMLHARDSDEDSECDDAGRRGEERTREHAQPHQKQRRKNRRAECRHRLPMPGARTSTIGRHRLGVQPQAGDEAVHVRGAHSDEISGHLIHEIYYSSRGRNWKVDELTISFNILESNIDNNTLDERKYKVNVQFYTHSIASPTTGSGKMETEACHE